MKIKVRTKHKAKIALIMGGEKGLGKAAAFLFSRQGAKLTSVGRQ